MLNLRSWLMFEVHGRRLPYYRVWIRQQECCVCGSTRNVDPAHIGPHGVWQKAADTNCVPLCRKHHDELHAIGRERFEPKYEICFEIIIKGLFTEWSERQARCFGQDISAVEWKPLATATLDAA